MQASSVTFNFLVLCYKIHWPGDNEVARPEQERDGGTVVVMRLIQEQSLRTHFTVAVAWRGCGFCGDWERQLDTKWLVSVGFVLPKAEKVFWWTWVFEPLKWVSLGYNRQTTSVVLQSYSKKKIPQEEKISGYLYLFVFVFIVLRCPWHYAKSFHIPYKPTEHVFVVDTGELRSKSMHPNCLEHRLQEAHSWTSH